MAIHRDPIFKGCTRPAMLLGVPLVPLLCTCIAFGLIAVWGGLLLGPIVLEAALVGCTCSVILMREVCKKDDQRFHQIGLWLRLRLGNPNRHFWGSVSYSSTRFRRLG